MSEKKAEIFIDEFKPYRSKYTIQEYNNLFQEATWVTKSKYLTKNLIGKSILEYLTVGYFVTNNTVFLPVDIDDHKNLGPAYLLNVYDQVVQRFSVIPSINFKSPRGLYAYYFFNQPVPTEMIIKQAKEKLKGLPVEIRPTQNTSLRIPAESRAIDPSTMQLLNMPFENCIKLCKKYHPAELFYTDILPETIRQSLREKKQSLKKIKAIPKIEKIENSVLPFVNGHTNDAFLQLCNVYRCGGLDQDEAFYRFKLCLTMSPGYTGDLHRDKRLMQRIKSEYKNNSYVPQPKVKTKNLFADVIVEKIIVAYREFHGEISTTAPHILTTVLGAGRNVLTDEDRRKAGITKQCKALRQILLGIFSWIDYQDLIWENKSEVAFWDYLYPFYRKNRKEGFYPLPRDLMRKWNFRYYEKVDFLVKIGFLIPAGYQYNPDLHICRYYGVNFEKFLS